MVSDEDALYKNLVQCVIENKTLELYSLIDNTVPAQIKSIINRQDSVGRTLLHTAVLLENPEIVEKLLTVGVDKTLKDTRNYTAADYAEDSRNERIRRLFGFLKEQPVAMQAVKPEKQRKAPNVKQEASKIPMPSVTTPQDMASYNVILGVPDSALLKAVRDQDYNATSKLLKSGKNVNETDINGNNALFYALVNGNSAILNLLLSYGINTNRQNLYGQKPLLYAVHKGNHSSIEALLNGGANINQKDTAGINAVMIAVFAHDAALLKFLHAKGAYLTGQDAMGNTLLHIAIKNEDIAIVRYLLENGCDMYAPNDKGIKPVTLLKNSERIELREMAKGYE